MGTEFDVVVVGELNADLILSGDVQPEFGQVEKLVKDATLTIGSSSAIFACGAARLGLRVAFVGKVGDDEFGRFMLRELRERGIDVRGVTVDATIKTGLTVIFSKGQDRAILTYPGSIPALRYAEIDLEILSRARHLHLGSYFLLDALRPDIPRLFEEAKGRELSVSLDTNYDPKEWWGGGLMETLKQADVFLPNETEAKAITRESDVTTALASLSQYVPLVVVKRGADGATAQRGDEIVSDKGISVEVVDTTGAGDSFDAGFIYGYLNGWELAKSLRLACVCGGLSTRAAGGTAAQVTLVEAMEKM